VSAATEYFPMNVAKSEPRSNLVNFGAIGYGYWGPNVVRNLDGLEGARIVAVSDKSPAARARAQKALHGMLVTPDANDVITSPDIDAVAIVTPVWTHFELAKAALENGKHVFVEKPFTSNVAQAEELINLAARKNLQIMVDHTFLFTGAVRKIKQLLDEDALGKLYYYDSTRVNLGLFQHDVNVIWDLAPHDLSIMDYLIDGNAEQIVATGQTHLNGHEDVAFITLYFPNDVIAHINVNWLSPVKVRTTLIGGEKKMLVWNDLEADEKIKVYDKGVKVSSKEGVYNLLVNYRSGDMWAPRLEPTEALRQELGYFVECINKSQAPFNDGLAGLRVVKMLEAASRSLRNRGAAIYLDPLSASSVNPPTLAENKQSPVMGVSHPPAAAAAASLG
jgi:predicted dehydrogenase